MAKMTKNVALKLIAAVAKKSAKIGSNSASVLGYHQPKEPAALMEVLHETSIEKHEKHDAA